jgi:hypothetical protein
LPNYGLTHRKPFGGSREPYGFLQYLLDFWDNLPPVTILTQDDCLKDGCSWGNALTQMRLMLHSWPKFWGIDHLTGAPMPITPENCLCRIYNENTFAKDKRYYWYRWMSFVQQHLLGTVPENRSTLVHWPQDATFAVSRLVLRSQPRWMYEALLRNTCCHHIFSNIASHVRGRSVHFCWVLARKSSTSVCSAAPSIKDVMKAAMKGDDSLFKKVSTGKGTDADTVKLYNCIKNMAGQKPPKGEQAAYDTKTNALIKAAEAVSKGGKDYQALSQAGNCKNCHSEHKGK